MVCDQLTAGLVRIRAVVVGRLGKAAVRLVTVHMCEGQEATTGTVCPLGFLDRVSHEPETFLKAWLSADISRGKQVVSSRPEYTA